MAVVTIYDIARRARVSHVTVSNVLNRHKNGEVSTRTAERVRWLAEKMGYVPNGAARSLRTGQTRTILVATHASIEYACTNRMVELLHDELVPHGYHLSLDLLHHVQDEAGFWRSLDPSRCDGLIRLGAFASESSQLLAIRSRGLPVVVAMGVSLPGLTGVDHDHMEATRLAVEHLLRQGPRRVAMVYGVGEDLDSPRVKGYRAALAAAGVPFDKNLLIRWVVADSLDELWVRIARLNPRPTAIFTYNEELAIGLLPLIRKDGLRVPDDIPIATEGNTRLVRLAEVPLTAVDCNPAGVAKAVVEQLLAQIRQPGSSTQHILIKPRLVVRQSSDRESGRPKANTREDGENEV